MKPKILIDSISLLSPLTGIGRYTYEISKLLKKNDEFELNFFYGFYSEKLINPILEKDESSFKKIIKKYSFLKKIARKLILFCSKYKCTSYDLYWQPNFIPNKNIKAKKIITSVHDFSFILYKDFHPKERVEYFENNFLQNIKKTDCIITGSNFTKNEIIQRLNFPRQKIDVIYHGIDHKIFKPYEKNEIDIEIKLPEKFIFSVGSIEPRKNLIGLLNAYDLLTAETKKEYKLVLVGSKGWENSNIKELLNKNKENILFLGFISDSELVKIYNLATCFVFPSFYEGFGLPVLESMACGLPVICSDSSSLPEVGGDAVLYCNPYDIVDIKNKIQTVLLNKSLQINMKKKGIERSKLFSWEKSAYQHMEVLKKVMKS